MSKVNNGEIGYKTLSIHDTLNNQLAEANQFHLISRIECYYNDKNIFGFFPFFTEDSLNKKILKGSYYNQFIAEYDKLKMRSIEKGIEIKHDTIKFTKGEAITQIKCIYDEKENIIPAIKFTKANTIYIYGNHPLFNKNKKDTIVIGKNQNFLTGLASNYLKKGEFPYLSFIKAHFEKEENYEKYYYAPKKPSQLPRKLINAHKKCCSLVMIILKIFIVIGMLLFPFGMYYYTSQNIYSGTLQIPNKSLNEKVKIYTDINGFTHIKANTAIDGYFALGFEHGKSRLWAMDRARRTGKGKLSELFGEKTLAIDRAMRSFGLNELAERSAAYVKKNSAFLKEIMAYIEGVNYYANNYILPIEYQLMQLEWKEWELSDSVAVMNLYSFGLSHDWNMEIWYKTLEDKMGKEFADYVFSFREMNYPFANETIVNDEELMEMGMNVNRKKSEEYISKERSKTETKPKAETKTKPQTETKANEEEQKKTEEIKENRAERPQVNNNEEKKEKEQSKKSEPKTQSKPQESEKKKTVEITKESTEQKQDPSSQKEAPKKPKVISKESDSNNDSKANKPNPKPKENQKTDDEIAGAFQSEGASNCWVISGNHTSSGKPLLSNDPHLPNGMPSLMFIAKLYLPTETITGATLPGSPFFASGSNTHISWGLTTENSDNTDLCEEKIEDGFYFYDNQKHPLTITYETIQIKGKEPVEIKIQWTRNGPILPSTIPRQLLVLNTDFTSETPLSFRSALFFFDFTNFDFCFRMNHAKSSKEIIPIVDLQPTPNYNFHWATVDGEIGWIPLGKMSVKKFSDRFCRGYTSEDDVIKYIPRIELPKLISPKKGFIVTANNKAVSFNYKYQLHGHHNHVRAYRIRQMIEEKILQNEKINVTNTVSMINDVKDSLAEYILPKLLKIIERNNNINPMSMNYFKNLTVWNYTMNKDSYIPTIYSVFERSIGKGLISNKIPDDHTAYSMMNYLHYWNFISGIIDKIYQGERVDLKQCIHESGNINCEKYLVHVFNRLSKTMKEEGFEAENGKIIKWGDLIFNDLHHTPLDQIPIVGEKIFSRRLYSAGNRNTVKISRNPFNHKKGPFVGTQAARIKFVCDMADPTKPYISIPGGNSGSVLNKYYDNILQKHENGELIQIENVDFDKVKNDGNEQVMILEKGMENSYYKSDE